MRFGIALGSNLGDRAANMQRGIELLLASVPGIKLAASSPIYETDPVDCAPGTQAFLNNVIEVEAACTPSELHAHLKAVELALGRPAQRERNSPRTLDLDLLYADEVISTNPDLILPHPRMHLRNFVMRPLADIRPELILPGFLQPVSAFLKKDTSARLYAK
ncbi:MAG: 2-amino-4-hydroxy-6-hydroxymethyldihydropteridine diphosphokinase [Prosthecobacter sp.]|uniref:2-amino-4-hydroxy-6- hydroxymethyldihydropteridine diphosphokinase n=1 Tax=Prosthecobacter sp. TaxID=1965333 RepID=UPI0038FEAFA8